MKFFIDTANTQEIKDLKEYFCIDGVTTNPALIASSGRRHEDVILEICDLVDGPISAEVISTEEKEMIKEGRALAKLHKNVVVKVPLIKSGLSTVRVLSKEGIKTNVTLCFSAMQALLAAQAGATIVSIFVGRLDDIEQSGMQVAADTLNVFNQYSLKTKVLVASIRNTQHVIDAALIGAPIITAPYKILDQLIHHPLTDIGLEKFLEAYRKSQK